MPIGAQLIVRCSEGHLYTTTWVPLASFKAIRLGRRRYQRCPVGRHWALTSPVEPDTLTRQELSAAEAIHD